MQRSGLAPRTLTGTVNSYRNRRFARAARCSVMVAKALQNSACCAGSAASSGPVDCRCGRTRESGWLGGRFRASSRSLLVTKGRPAEWMSLWSMAGPASLAGRAAPSRQGCRGLSWAGGLRGGSGAGSAAGRMRPSPGTGAGVDIIQASARSTTAARSASRSPVTATPPSSGHSFLSRSRIISG